MFCDILKKLRHESNLTQSELADRLNITRSALSLYELGKRTPDFNTLIKIADNFDVSIDFLLRRNEKNNTLGSRIKVLRKEYNMTQTDLANKLNITKSNISKYENNIVDPSLEILKTMSDIFDVSVDYLLGKTNIRKDVNTFAAHTDDEDLSEEAKAELENFKDYLRNKYSK